MGPAHDGIGEGLFAVCFELGIGDAHQFSSVLAIMSSMDIVEEDALVLMERLTVDWDAG